MNTIGTINLSEATEVIFYLDTYREKHFANIRKFIKSKKYTGPTKSGIKLNKKELQIIYEALRNLSPDLSILEECELCKIQIYNGKFISVRIKSFMGSYGIDIREYIETEKYNGPLKKGVRIPFSYLDNTVLYLEDMLKKIDSWSEESLFFHKKSEDNKIQPNEEGGKEVEGVPDEYRDYY